VPGSGRVGPIRLAATGVNSGAYELATHRFFYFQKTFSPHAVAGSQDEVVQLVAAHPNALGFVSLACLKDTASSRTAKESVRSLDFMGADSTGKPVRLRLHQANVYLAKYPLYFPVWMFVHSAKSPLAVGFSGFVANNPGQQIVLNRGLVPATIPVRLVQLTE
jgi:phosphate transport system substrate-binding protein